MLIKISPDTWRDIFDWLGLSDRRQLARKFDEMGDREFSDIFQKWLHEWTKNVCIGNLTIDSAGNGDVAQLSKNGQILPFAETEWCPDNIQGFNEVELRYMDTTVLQFLHQLEPLFHGVNLHICSSEDGAELTVLGRLMPLLNGSIHILSLDKQQQLFAIQRQFPAQFLAVKHVDMDMLFLITRVYSELLVSWLGTKYAEGGPRILTIRYICMDMYALEFIERIRQQFLSAAEPSSFFAYLNLTFYLGGTIYEGIPESTAQNAVTSEQLIIRKGWGGVLIVGRCASSGLDGQQWMEEMREEYHKKWMKMEERTISKSAFAFQQSGKFKEQRKMSITLGHTKSGS